MELRLDRSCSLYREDLHRPSHHRWQDGNSEEHYSQRSYPLREGTPEQYAMRQMLHIIENTGASGSKARHGLKIGIGKVSDISSHHIRQRAKEAIDRPRQGNDEEGVFSRHVIIGITSQVSQDIRSHLCHEDRDDKGEDIILLI